MKTLRNLFFVALLGCLFPAVAHAQSCSPFGAVGNVQFLDNFGGPLTNGVLYSFQAGTSTQQATFTDATCSVQNVNPITFGTGARVAIWLTTSNVYKFVLCAQNDGAACAGGDILFSIDQVPGGVTGGGGGGGAPFISNSASPATSGILRLATGDSICWRNQANSSNVCFKKDTNDLLSWDGGSLKLPEVSAPTPIAGFDILYADNTHHRYYECGNGGACSQIVIASASGSGDISLSDTVQALHFGATQETLSGTAPTTGQFLQWNGSNIVGTAAAPVAAAANQTGQTANIGATTLITPSANGFYRISCYIVLTTAAATSSTLPGCILGYTDADSGQALTAGLLSSTDNANLPGSVAPILVTAAGSNPPFFFAKSGVAITYATSGYLSNPAATMQYAIHVRLEGPF